jgi:hypothetical protein
LDSVTRFLSTVMDKISEHYWAVVGNDENLYTVGLTFLRLPELLIRATPWEIATPLLNGLAAQQRAQGEFSPGQVIEVQGFTVRVDALPDLTDLTFVQALFADNYPVPPRALVCVPQ